MLYRFVFCVALAFQSWNVYCNLTDQVTCSTSAGRMLIDVHSEWSVLDTANFLTLIRSNFYKNSPFSFNSRKSFGVFGDNLKVPSFDSSAKLLMNNYVFFTTSSDTDVVFGPQDLHSLDPTSFHPAFGVVKLDTGFLKDVQGGVVLDCSITTELTIAHRTIKSLTNNFERFNVADDDSLLEEGGLEIDFEANELQPRIFNRPLNVGKAKSKLTDDFGFPREDPVDPVPLPVEQNLSTEAAVYGAVVFIFISGVVYYWYRTRAANRQPLLGKFV